MGKNFLAAIHKRPLTQEILAWEMVERNELTAELETIRENTMVNLSRRLENSHIDSTRIRGYNHHYKIKLRSAGYRLVYEVEEKEITVFVICVGRRDTIYKILKKSKL